MEADRRPVTWVHANAVVVGEVGVLIRGSAGAGKSTLALALIREAVQMRRFGRLVADDTVGLKVFGDRVLAYPHLRTAGLAECRGLGIIKVEHEPACVVRMVVDFVGPDSAGRDVPRLPEPDDLRAVLLGVGLHRLRLRPDAPVSDNVGRVFQSCGMFRPGS